MAEQVFEEYAYHPVIQATPASTAWYVVASDGSTYTTQALLLAARKTPFGLPNTTDMASKMLIRSDATGGTAGSGFYIAFDSLTAPSTGFLVGAGQVLPLPGGFTNLWIQTNGTDTIDVLYLS